MKSSTFTNVGTITRSVWTVLDSLVDDPVWRIHLSISFTQSVSSFPLVFMVIIPTLNSRTLNSSLNATNPVHTSHEGVGERDVHGGKDIDDGTPTRLRCRHADGRSGLRLLLQVLQLGRDIRDQLRKH